jgi:hypothetical protein
MNMSLDVGAWLEAERTLIGIKAPELIWYGAGARNWSGKRNLTCSNRGSQQPS